MRLILCRTFCLAAACFLLSGVPAHAIIFYDTGDALLNTTAPSSTGDYADSGWQYQGRYGAFLGTMIGEQYFITAGHFGTNIASTFTSLSTEVTYTIESSANGGQGFWAVPGTDLRIYKINETFSDYAQLYTGSGEKNQELVVFGRGGPRGAEVELNGEHKGWYHTGSDGVARWGTNYVKETLTVGGASYLQASFDALPGTLEATLSAGDSGGAVFINDNGVWKLAGINYGVDGLFGVDNIPYNDGVPGEDGFSAALFDSGGFYLGSDQSGWSSNPMPEGSSANFYATRISPFSDQIQAIVAVPEPGSAFLLALAAGALFLRRNRKVLPL